MPNHTKNDLEIRGPEDVLQKIKDLMFTKTDSVDESPNYFDLNNVVPMPPEIIDSVNGRDPGLNPDWYDWSVNNWGTKWNTYNTDTGFWNVLEASERILSFWFETAWSPPEPVVEELARRFPTAKFMHHYVDEGGGYDGIIIYTEGEIAGVLDVQAHKKEFKERFGF